MSDPIGPAVQTARDKIKSVTEQATKTGAKAAADAASVAQDAKARASRLASDAGDQASSAANNQKDAVAERMEDMARAVHRSGEQLEGQSDYVAKLVERGADELSGLAATLRSNDLQGLADKAQNLAKRQPALFVGAAMVAGFAAVRFGRVAAAGASRSDLPHMPETLDGR